MATVLFSSGDCFYTVRLPTPSRESPFSSSSNNPPKGAGALLAIAAIKHESFGGFCACIFIIGNGLGSLETAANPYITSKSSFMLRRLQELIPLFV